MTLTSKNGARLKRLNIPLLIGELGVDAAAYHTPDYIQSFYYALQELKMYQEILLYARPRGTMQWEFTSDYPLVLEHHQVILYQAEKKHHLLQLHFFQK